MTEFNLTDAIETARRMFTEQLARTIIIDLIADDAATNIRNWGNCYNKRKTMPDGSMELTYLKNHRECGASTSALLMHRKPGITGSQP